MIKTNLWRERIDNCVIRFRKCCRLFRPVRCHLCLVFHSVGGGKPRSTRRPETETHRDCTWYQWTYSLLNMSTPNNTDTEEKDYANQTPGILTLVDVISILNRSQNLHLDKHKYWDLSHKPHL